MAGMRFAMMFMMLVGKCVTAETEIHRCLLDDGTIPFQETPCSEPAVNADAARTGIEGPRRVRKIGSSKILSTGLAVV